MRISVPQKKSVSLAQHICPGRCVSYFLTGNKHVIPPSSPLCLFIAVRNRLFPSPTRLLSVRALPVMPVIAVQVNTSAIRFCHISVNYQVCLIRTNTVHEFCIQNYINNREAYLQDMKSACRKKRNLPWLRRSIHIELPQNTDGNAQNQNNQLLRGRNGTCKGFSALSSLINKELERRNPNDLGWL